MDLEDRKEGQLKHQYEFKEHKKGWLRTILNPEDMKGRLVKKTMDLEGTKKWQVWHHKFNEHKRKAGKNYFESRRCEGRLVKNRYRFRRYT
jgi:hypothetical protein